MRRWITQARLRVLAVVILGVLPRGAFAASQTLPTITVKDRPVNVTLPVRAGDRVDIMASMETCEPPDGGAGNQLIIWSGDFYMEVTDPFVTRVGDFKATQDNQTLSVYFERYDPVSWNCCDEQGTVDVTVRAVERKTRDEVEDLKRIQRTDEWIASACVAVAYKYKADPVRAAIAAGCGWAFHAMGKVRGQQAADPPDPNFTVIDQPVNPNLPRVRQGGGITRALADAMNAWRSSTGRQYALARALMTAINRSQGAADAGDTHWENQQLQAAATYAAEASSLLTHEASLRATVVSAMLASGFAPFTLTTADVDAAKFEYWNNYVITDDDLALLRPLGGDRFISEARRYEAAAMVATRSTAAVVALGRFPDLLTSPELAAADAAAAAAMAQFATRNGVAVLDPRTPYSPTFKDVTSTSVSVVWTSSGPGVTTYTLQRGPTTAGPWSVMASGVSSLSVADTGLEPNTSYCYRLQAIDVAGPTEWSRSRCATTLDPPPSGAPGTPTSPVRSPTQLSLEWTTAAGASTYKLERAPDESGAPGPWTQFAGPTSATSQVDRFLSPMTRYWYRVRGANGASNGPYSEPIGIQTTPTEPGMPTFSDVGPHTVTLTWAAPASGAAAYAVDRTTNPADPYLPWTRVASGVASTTYTDTTAAPNMKYWYAIWAANEDGWTGPGSSAPFVVTPPDATGSLPAAPDPVTYPYVDWTYVNLQWTAVADADSYKLERAPDLSGVPGQWTEIATALTALTYRDSGRTVNTAYWYRVRATNGAGDGTASEPSNVITRPGAPGTPTFSDIGPRTVTVHWTAPVGGAATYSVSRATSANGPWTTIASGLVDLMYLDSGVGAYSTYFYIVRSHNAAGLWGYNSYTGSVSIPVVQPGAPGAPTYTSTTGSSLTLTWSAAAGATSYKVERAPDVAGAPGAWTQVATGVSTPTYADSGWNANTAYWYRVRGANVAGDGPLSDASTTVTPPGSPGTLYFPSQGPSSVTVTWTAPAGGAVSYKLERATASVGQWTEIASGLVALTYTDVGLTPDMYSYQVRATNAVGFDGNYSREAAVIVEDLPGAPGTPTYAPGERRSLLVSWAAAAGASSYKVERALDEFGVPGAWSVAASGLTASPFVDSFIEANTGYWYRVAGMSRGGFGPYSSGSNVLSPPNVPATPTFSTVTPTSLTVSWYEPVSGAASYAVDRAGAATGPWTTVAANLMALSYQDSGLRGATTYYYRVRALNVEGLWSTSDANSVTTPRDPGAPAASPHRYWRLLCTGTAGSYLGFAEIELRSDGIDLTGAGVPSDSGHYSDWDSAKAVDDSTATAFTTFSTPATTSNPALWAYDFGPGNAPAITEIAITPRQDGYFSEAPRDFCWQWSDDGVSWTSQRCHAAWPWPTAAQQVIPVVADTSSAPAYMGCYTDSEPRALPVLLMSSGATVESCTTAARSNGLRYAGLQWYGSCFGGNTLGYVLVNDSECNTPCTANSAQMCGGSYRNSVWDVSPMDGM